MRMMVLKIMINMARKVVMMNKINKEQPCLSLVNFGEGGLLIEETTDETTVRGNAGARGNHDEVGFGVLLRHEHNLARGAGQLNFVTRVGVAKEVGADALLGRVISL